MLVAGHDQEEVDYTNLEHSPRPCPGSSPPLPLCLLSGPEQCPPMPCNAGPAWYIHWYTPSVHEKYKGYYSWSWWSWWWSDSAACADFPHLVCPTWKPCQSNREVACNNLADDDNDDDQLAITIIIANREASSNNLRIVGVLDWCSRLPFMRL